MRDMRVFLKPIELKDSQLIVKWRNSPSVRDHCFDKNEITEESNKRFFDAYIKTGKYKQYIVYRIDDDYGVISYPIASIYLKDMDAYNQRCELCIFTSDDEEWNTESQRKAILLMLDIAFNKESMRKVYSYVFQKNSDEVALLENSGFKKEALLEKEAVGLDGELLSVYRMAAFKEDYHGEN